MLRRSSARPLFRSLEGDVLAQAPLSAIRPLPILALTLAVAACAPSDRARISICSQALSALAPDARTIGRAGPTSPDTVRSRYRLNSREFELSCRFAPRALESDGLDLRAVRPGHEGLISPAVLFLLKTYGLGRGDQVEGTPSPPRPISPSNWSTVWLRPPSTPCSLLGTP